MIALPLLGSAAVAVGCHESPAPNPAAMSDARSLDSGHATKRERGEAQIASARSEYAWIGEAHNKALDDLRTELRKPGTLTKDFCGFAVGFFSKAERFPAGKSHGAANDRVQAAKAIAKEATLCRSVQTSNVALQSGVSSAALDLANKIQYDIDLASNRYDLRTRLAARWQAALGLNAMEYEIIASTLSTAQSSFEYWETEVVRANQEFEAEYSRCADEAFADGYDEAGARQVCLEGKIIPTLDDWHTVPRLFRVVAFHPTPGCGLSSHFKTLAKSDAGGAFGGAVKGGLTGGLAGIIPGALVGAAVGSATSWAYSAWELYWCAVK